MSRTYSMSLNQMLLEFGIMLKDAAFQTVTVQGATNELTVGRLAFGDSDRYQGAEVWLWDKPVGMTAVNPLLVKNSDGSGKLTFTEPVGPNPVPANARFVLQNFGGKGHPHALKEQAIRFALLEQGAMAQGVVALEPPEPNIDWQIIPEGLDSIQKVVIRDGTQEWEVSPGYWKDINLQERTINLPFDFSGSRTVSFYGRVNVTYPWLATVNYDTAIDVEPTELIKDAHIWLLLNHRDEKSASVMANLYNDKLRTRRNLPLPGEVFLR